MQIAFGHKWPSNQQCKSMCGFDTVLCLCFSSCSFIFFEDVPCQMLVRQNLEGFSWFYSFPIILEDKDMETMNILTNHCPKICSFNPWTLSRPAWLNPMTQLHQACHLWPPSLEEDEDDAASNDGMFPSIDSGTGAQS